MPGSVPAAAELAAYLPRGDGKGRGEGVQDAAFSHAGIAREAAYLPSQGLPQRRDAVAGCGAHPPDGIARPGVDRREPVPRGEVAFVNNEGRGAAVFLAADRDSVREVRLRHGNGLRYDHHEKIDVCDRRAGKGVFSGQDLRDGPGAVGVYLRRDPVADERRHALAAEPALRPAGELALGAADVIEAAQRADDGSLRGQGLTPAPRPWRSRCPPGYISSFR